MKKYALIGYPLGHSMSPLIHDELFRIKNRESSYSLEEISPEELDGKGDFLRGLNGFNVTIPHKINVIKQIDELAESAERYNSVNCVANDGEKLIGYNTDCDGFLTATKEFPLDKNVLLIGCGGVGRMMAIETALHGGSVTLGIIPEAMESAQKLKEEITAKIPEAVVNIAIISELDGKYDVILNASPVGMYPKTEACPVSDEIISGCTHVFDAVYNPVKTQLITKAEAMGKVAVGGASMLVYQAVKAHEIWDGDFYSEEEINKIIKAVEDKINEGQVK
ncbi:MAG: shikimate dehydrogenase [Ruminococcus sp.]|nr:shikimate dehydrogenase [Ruminococcus sp.]